MFCVKTRKACSRGHSSSRLFLTTAPGGALAGAGDMRLLLGRGFGGVRPAARRTGTGLGGGFEVVQNAAPECIEMRLERGDARRVDLVDALRSGVAVAD